MQTHNTVSSVKAKPVVEYDEHGNLIDDSGDEEMTSDEQVR